MLLYDKELELVHLAYSGYCLSATPSVDNFFLFASACNLPIRQNASNIFLLGYLISEFFKEFVSLLQGISWYLPF